MITMTLTNPEWTRKEIVRGWDGEFTGTYRGTDHNPAADIMTLMSMAVDYAVEHIDEIRADAA